LITGAGSGPGRELSKVFIERGYIVVGTGRSVDRLKETKSLTSTPENYHYFEMDVAIFSSVEKVVKEVRSKYGSIELLINNAATYDKENFIDESAEIFAKSIEINVVGTAICCKAVLPNMVASNNGTIINVGSWAHKRPIVNSASYSASKAAVHSLTKAIAEDLQVSSSNVKIIEWIPGHMNTQMSDFTGTAPSIFAAWCSDIIVKTDFSGNHAIFEGNTQWHEPLSIKQKIKAKLKFIR